MKSQVQVQEQSQEQSQSQGNQSGSQSNSSVQNNIATAGSSFSSLLRAEGGKLHVGMRDSAAVTALQDFLQKKGYGISVVDGWFGNNTASCVRKFQADNNLYVDGWVGMQTAGLIDSMQGTSAPATGNSSGNSSDSSSSSSGGSTAVENTLPANPSALQAPAPWLEKGSSGSTVTALQNALNSLNFNCGRPDGSFGNWTKNALIRFQAAYGMAQDGRYGPQTQSKLQAALSGSASAVGTGQSQNQNQEQEEGQNTSTGAPNGAVAGALAWTRTQIGTPYYGGASPYRDGHAPGNGQTYQQSGQQAYVSQLGVIGYDCSGFVMAFNRQLGKDIGHQNTTSLSGYPPVTKANIQPGDIIVKPGSHVVIYLGNNEVIHSTNPHTKISNADRYLDDSAYSIHRTW